MTVLCHLSSCLSVSLLSVSDCGVYLGPSLAPCPSLLTPGSRASRSGEVWGLCCHSRPPAGRAVTRALGGSVADTGLLQQAGAARLLTTLPSSSILPPHPTLFCTDTCCSAWPRLLDGSGGHCGPAREKYRGGMLCSQPLHCPGTLGFSP